MVEKESWREFFPYEPHFGQDKIADFITKIISDKKIGVVEAPYGIGKTITMLSCGLAFSEPLETQTEKTSANSTNRKKLVFATCDHAIQETVVKEVFALNKKLNKKLVVASILGKHHMCPYLEKFDYDVCDYERFHDRCPFYNNTYSKKTKKIKKLSILTSSLLSQIKSLIFENFFEDKKFVHFVIEQCKEKKLCPYEIMLELASESDVVVLDYFHVFTPILFMMEKRIFNTNETMLFVDEADRLQPRLLDILTVGVSSLSLYRLSKQIKKAMKRQKQLITIEDYNFYLLFYNNFKNFLKEKLQENKTFLEKENIEEELYIDVAREELINFLEKALSMNFHEIIFKLNNIIENLFEYGFKKVASRPDKFLFLWLTRENYFSYILFTEKNIYLRLSPYELVNSPLIEINKPLKKQFYLQDILTQFYSVVLFSATIGEPEIFLQSLGIEKAEFFSSDQFNTQDYFVFLKKDVSSIYKKRDYNIEKVIKDINFIEEKLGGLLLAFPSYDCGKVLLSSLELKHISELEKEEQTKEAEEKENKKNIYWVVLGGRGSRGINKAAKLPAVYVFGLQLPKPTDYLFQKRKSYMLKKYTREKALQLLYNNVVNQSCQVAGRIFREENKKGIVILADDRYKFDRIVKNFFYNCIPNYFKIKLKEISNQDEFEKVMKEFWSV